MTELAADIVAIDAHVHLSDARARAAKPLRSAQMARYFGREQEVVPVEEMAQAYRRRNMMRSS